MSFILTELAAQYRQWSLEMVAATRKAHELDSMNDRDVDHANAAVLEARLRRDAAAERYIAESERLRSKKCGHPIEVNIVACRECCRVNEFVSPEVRAIGSQR